MNAIIGFTNLAVTHLDDREVVRSYLSKITASSSHLLSLINDVLDMSRIESGKVVIEETVCYLPQVLRDLQSMVQTDLEAKGLNFCLDDSALAHPYVVRDRLRLNQVLLNVLSNALNQKIAVTILEEGGYFVDVGKLFATLQSILGPAQT